jgi:anthranilate phosphoribosyltransferase
MLTRIIHDIAEGPSEPGELCPDPNLLNGAFQVMMRGQARPEQIAALLMGLRVRGIEAPHLKATVDAMLDHVLPFPMVRDYPMLFDTCGTGGSGRTTINISTAAALVAAAAGLKIAKHGNWSVSSKSGSANVMEVFGYKIDCSPQLGAEMLDKHNFTFLFAPFYHPSMGHAGPIRRELKIRTIFNLAGPLANPVMPTHQMVGVVDRSLLGIMAKTLRDLGRQRAAVVHGRNGIDEVSLMQVTEVLHLRADGKIEEFSLEPRDFGARMIEIADLVVESPEDSGRRVRAILEGEKGPASDQVNANVAMVLWLADQAEDMKHAFGLAREVQESGKAAQILDQIVAISRRDMNPAKKD